VRKKEITTLKAEHTKALEAKDGEITQLKQEATSVRDELAALGVPPKELPPKQPQGSSKNKLADLAAKAAAATDPAERVVSPLSSGTRCGPTNLHSLAILTNHQPFLSCLP